LLTKKFTILLELTPMVTTYWTWTWSERY